MLKGLLALLVCAVVVHCLEPTPIVLWHGMGDTCCYSFSMGALKKGLEEAIPGVYVHSLKIGDTIEEDAENGFFMNVNKQVDLVCAQLKNDTNLAGKSINAIGFSQGGQFLRAYVQRCNDPPVKNLISIGGQHQGVFGFPKCPGDITVCNWVRELLDYGAYVSFVQEGLVQAEYWQDPYELEEYKEKSIFLADINNEKPTKNMAYKKNLLSLNKFVMVMFTEDTMVQPKESEWFGFYAPKDPSTIIPMEESTLYKEDWLGLKEMNENNRLEFLEVVGDHLRFNQTWFQNYIIDPYLKK